MGVTFPTSVHADRLVKPGMSTQAPTVQIGAVAAYRRAKNSAAVDPRELQAKIVDRRHIRLVVVPGKAFQVTGEIIVYNELAGARRVVGDGADLERLRQDHPIVR
jgi:hypothetical protein